MHAVSIYASLWSAILQQIIPSIDRWAFRGLHPSTSSLNYPYQPRPPPESWEIWQHALHSTFLASNRTNNYLLLTERLTPLVPSQTPAPPTSSFQQLQSEPLFFLPVTYLSLSSAADFLCSAACFSLTIAASSTPLRCWSSLIPFGFSFLFLLIF